MQDFIDLGYVTEVKSRSEHEFFLSHQAVFKHSSLTTKLRVVFDASAASSTGVSLNDALLAGPTIQDNIFSLLLRFRIYKYVLTADIEKMYLQIKIREEDQPYLRFLWKEKDETVQTYQFNRLIFGLKPASYIATKCLHRLAEDEGARFPEAAKILRRDLYVDDLLTGADSLTALTHLQRQLTCLLKEGGFNLRQCASSSIEVMQAIPDRCVNLQLHEYGDTTLKRLGVHWDSANDRITYTVQPFIERKSTKRIIFSEVARIYDPLGLIDPVAVNAKLLIQELWKLGVDWDESLQQQSTRNGKHSRPICPLSTTCLSIDKSCRTIPMISNFMDSAMQAKEHMERAST